MKGDNKYAVLTPAYGRDYKSAKAARGDFLGGKTSVLGGKDFILRDITSPWDGKPANYQDLKRAGYTHAEIRYARLTKLTVVKL